jgi:hypothetical protein
VSIRLNPGEPRGVPTGWDFRTSGTGPLHLPEGVHLSEVAGGQTYSQVSAKAIANPSDQQLAGQVQTLFRGETLRGLLLNAYAFDTMAAVALVAGWICGVAGVVLFVLAVLGVRHARRALPAAAAMAAQRVPVA